jgi:hypothetical protein
METVEEEVFVSNMALKGPQVSEEVAITITIGILINLLDIVTLLTTI